MAGHHLHPSLIFLGQLLHDMCNKLECLPQVPVHTYTVGANSVRQTLQLIAQQSIKFSDIKM